jgi:hypothetical protein
MALRLSNFSIHLYIWISTFLLFVRLSFYILFLCHNSDFVILSSNFFSSFFSCCVCHLPYYGYLEFLCLSLSFMCLHLNFSSLFLVFAINTKFEFLSVFLLYFFVCALVFTLSVHLWAWFGNLFSIEGFVGVSTFLWWKISVFGISYRNINENNFLCCLCRDHDFC